jgi:hypothetical protein
MDVVIDKLDKVNLANNNAAYQHRRNNKIRTSEELTYALQLASTLKRIHDYVEIRVESPWVSIYTNDLRIVDTLVKLDETKVKYVSSPAVGTTLEEGMIIISNRDYDYRVTVGKTMQEHTAFVEWADANSDKTRLTKSCRKDLLNDSSWGGSYFYITGDNALLMAKMLLGSVISKVETITRK